MLFNSTDYLLFFPIVVLVTFIIPPKVRYIWLLAASYYFYMSWNAVYALLIVTSTAVTWICGLAVEAADRKIPDEKKKTLSKRCILATSLLINFGILFYFKYTNFALHTVQQVLNRAGIAAAFPTFDIILPIGISFFTFQAAGYTIDVYRGETAAERNPLRYALFVAFFPQLVAGPIERSKNLLKQLETPASFDVMNAKNGLLTMAYGIFLKIVVADNIAVIVDRIYAAPDEHAGMELLVATMLFAFQIYCDFNGYTKIAIGSAQVLGYRLMNNFNAPYFAGSVKDFWRRWHISLNSWFIDYLYIPLGGSRAGRVRKQCNTLFVFLCSGLWHGAAWHYVVWGGLNGLMCILEDLFSPFITKVFHRLHIDTTKIGFRVFRRFYTFAFIDLTMLFFRAESLGICLRMLKRIIADFRFGWLTNLEVLSMFETPRSFVVIAGSLILLFLIDLATYKGTDVKAVIFQQQIVFRWVIYTGFLMLILFWGLYGNDYAQTQFIYFQF